MAKKYSTRHSYGELKSGLFFPPTYVIPLVERLTHSYLKVSPHCSMGEWGRNAHFMYDGKGKVYFAVWRGISQH